MRAGQRPPGASVAEGCWVSLSGQVLIRLPDRVGVRRPAAAEQLFADKPVAQVVEMVRLLYSLCGTAQQIAARLALGEAIEEPAQTHALALEALREHLLFLVDFWPELRPLLQGIAGWNRLDEAALEEKLTPIEAQLGLEDRGQYHFYTVAEKALEKTMQKPRFWPQKAPENHYLNADAAQVLQNMAYTPGWCQRPELDTPQENSPYARACTTLSLPHDAAGRLAARLWDVTQWLALLRGEQAVWPLWGTLDGAEGWRLAWVETARGRLYHAAVREGDTVRAYRLCAPTEWNFHPCGPLAQWLSAAPGRVDGNMAREWARWLDPCVAIEVEEAACA